MKKFRVCQTRYPLRHEPVVSAFNFKFIYTLTEILINIEKN